MNDDVLDLDIAPIGAPANSPTSPNARALARSSAARKVVVIPLALERQFTTLGSTTYKFYVVGPRHIANVGPFVEDIVGHARGKDFTALFKWKLVGERSVDQDGWTVFTSDIIAEQTAAGSPTPTVHNTRGDYGLNLRFLIGVANVSGTAIEVGNLTAYAAVKFWT